MLVVVVLDPWRCQSSAMASAVMNASAIVDAITPVGPRFTQPAQYRPGIGVDLVEVEVEVEAEVEEETMRPKPSCGKVPR